jgi:hypothetical protein
MLKIVRDGSIVIFHLVLYLKYSSVIIYTPATYESSPFNLGRDFSAFFMFCDSSSRNNIILNRLFKRINSFKVHLRTRSDGNIKQRGLFSNTPKCDGPFQGAGVAGSTFMKQHLFFFCSDWLRIRKVCTKCDF